jgi:hypothetical protein
MQPTEGRPLSGLDSSRPQYAEEGQPRGIGRDQGASEFQAHSNRDLTTSRLEEDILRTYDLGANSFITKPMTFESLVNIVQVLGNYWVEIVELPTTSGIPAAA